MEKLVVEDMLINLTLGRSIISESVELYNVMDNALIKTIKTMSAIVN